ncbi:MAG: hypothetical protein KGL02_02700 [Acidobacteriota bacterium]|nr:hypothetical protein [Acidobacteriota bacterium]MDE3171340.1 hypothetical protein [Acidobacteriota bacterium]
MKIARCGWIILSVAVCAAGLGVQPLNAAALARQSPQPEQQSQAQPAPAQNHQRAADSLGAAARRAREQKKDESKSTKVWDNDNLPTAGDVNVIGASAQSSSTQGAGGAAEENAEGSAPNNAESSETADRSELEAQIKSAKENLNQLQTQLNFAQRKFALDQQSFYQNPNYASDRAGAQALKREQDQIDAQKQQVESAKKKVDDLNAKLQDANKSAGSKAQSAAGESNSGSSEEKSKSSSQQ